MLDTPLPTRQALKEAVEFLMGRAATAADGDRLALGSDFGSITVGTIVDDGGHLRALLLADVAFTVFAGACLGVIPPGGAQDMVEEGEVTQMISENFYEVLNVLSSVFNVDEAPHVRLGTVYTRTADVPSDVVAASKSFGRREDTAISIGGYGTGNLSVILVG